MPEISSTQLQARFIQHLADTLRMQLMTVCLDVGLQFGPLCQSLAGDVPDVPRARTALDQVQDEWREREPSLVKIHADTREMITRTLNALRNAMDLLPISTEQAEAFVKAVLRCEDEVFALGMILRMATA